jgi:Sec-independent protein secretion pathway component TatC
MINFDKKVLLKKWIPIIVIIFVVSSLLGLLLGIPGSQILSAVVVSLILITSAFLFQMVGRNRFDNQNDKMGLSKCL